MTIALPKDLHDRVRRQIDLGGFACDEDVLREGLRLVETIAAHREALRRIIRNSIDEGGNLSDEAVGEALERQSGGHV